MLHLLRLTLENKNKILKKMDQFLRVKERQTDHNKKVMKAGSKYTRP